mgnify:FL=1|jgi:hypothetical protein
MSEESNYLAEQEYKEYQRLINTVEILTQAEYEFCKAWNADEAWKYLNDIGGGRWLNINVYSEIDKEDYDLRREQGL